MNKPFFTRCKACGVPDAVLWPEDAIEVALREMGSRGLEEVLRSTNKVPLVQRQAILSRLAAAIGTALETCEKELKQAQEKETKK